MYIDEEVNREIGILRKLKDRLANTKTGKVLSALSVFWATYTFSPGSVQELVSVLNNRINITDFIGFMPAARAQDFSFACDPNNEPDLWGYKIFYGNHNGGPYDGAGGSESDSPVEFPLSGLPDPNNPTFQIHGLSSTKNWYFVAVARDIYGNISNFSNQLQWLGGSADTTPPVVSADAFSRYVSGSVFRRTGDITDDVELDDPETLEFWLQKDDEAALDITDQVNVTVVNNSHYAFDTGNITVGEGDFTLTIKAWDYEGNQAVYSDSQTLIENPPVILSDDMTGGFSGGTLNLDIPFEGVGVSEGHAVVGGRTLDLVMGDGVLQFANPMLVSDIAEHYGALDISLHLTNGLGSEFTKHGEIIFESETGSLRQSLQNPVSLDSMDNYLLWNNNYPQLFGVSQDTADFVEGSSSMKVDYAYDPSYSKRYLWRWVDSGKRDWSAKNVMDVWIRSDKDARIGLMARNSGSYTSIKWIDVSVGSGDYAVDISDWSREDVDKLYIKFDGREGYDYQMSIDDIVLADAIVNQSSAQNILNKVQLDSMDNYLLWNNIYPQLFGVSQDTAEFVEGSSSMKVDYTYDPSYNQRYLWRWIDSGKRDWSAKNVMSMWVNSDRDARIGLMARNSGSYTSIRWIDVKSGSGRYVVDISDWSRADVDKLYLKFDGREGYDYQMSIDDISLGDGLHETGGGLFDWKTLDSMDSLLAYLNRYPELFQLSVDTANKVEGSGSLKVDFSYNPSYSPERYIHRPVDSGDQDESQYNVMRLWTMGTFAQAGQAAQIGIMARNAGSYTGIQWFDVASGKKWQTMDISQMPRDLWQYLYFKFKGDEGYDYQVNLDSLQLVDTKGEKNVYFSDSKNSALVIRWDD